MIEPLTMLAALGTLFWMGVVAWAILRWGRSLSHGGVVDRAKWEMYAAERQHTYHPDPMNPRIRGVHKGVSFEVGARIIRSRRRDGRTIERAITSIRATHRAALPAGLTVHKRSLGRTLGSLVVGRRAIAIDDDYDDFFRVEADDAEAARRTLLEPEVKRAFLSLIVDLPEASVHERAIEAEIPGMASDITALDVYLDRVTDLANALRAVAPQVDQTTAESAPEGTAGATPAPMRRLPTAAELPPQRETLSGALRRIAGASSKTSAGVQASSMRVRPYEYELEVRVIDQATSRLGVPTGGRLVRGLLVRSPWRAEISFPPADNDIVDAIRPTDVISGLALVDDFRAVSQVVECTAQTPPMVTTPGAARDKVGPPGSGPAPA